MRLSLSLSGTLTVAACALLAAAAAVGCSADAEDVDVDVAASGVSTDTVRYRVNAGGATLSGTPSWSTDTQSAPSPYSNYAETGNKTASTTHAIDLSHPSIPAGTPSALFQTERYSTGTSASSAPMRWHFPTTAGQSYEVRLYFAEIFSGCQMVGCRKYDVAIEGKTVLNDYDTFADVGGYKGVVKAFAVTPDASLDVDLIPTGVQSPRVMGIEVVQKASTTADAGSDSGGVAPSCSGVAVSPGSTTIKDAVAAHGTGTTFCLAPGSYDVSATISPKSGDTFIGTAASRDGVVVKTTNTQIIFETGGTTGVTFRHFAITGAVNACPGQNCGETGRAISRGTNVTVDDMHLYGNGLNGVGACSDGLVVTRSEIDHNGAKAGDGVSGGVKSVSSFTVRDSFIHDNNGNGTWCDIQCGNYVVTGNTITGNTANGIFMEISQGPATIADNVVKNNNTSNSAGKGGISVTDSENAAVYRNDVAGNKNFDIAARMDNRINCGAPSSSCGFVLSNVSIHDNTLNGGVLAGCGLAGVTCTNNH